MVPKLRTSKARQGKRRSHDALRASQLSMCPNCGTPRASHAACPNCGYVRPGLRIKRSKEE